MITRKATALTFSLASLAFGVIYAQPSASAPDMSVLRAAGVDLPEQLGGLVREEVNLIGPDQISAEYRAPSPVSGAPMVHFLIGRALLPLAHEFADNETSIRRTLGTLTVIRDLPAPRGAPGAMGRLWRVDQEDGPLLIGVVIWQRGGWRIKIRGLSQNEEGWAAVQRLIDAFDWGRAPASAPAVATSAPRTAPGRS